MMDRRRFLMTSLAGAPAWPGQSREVPFFVRSWKASVNSDTWRARTS
jgi:hypothetical protein